MKDRIDLHVHSNYSDGTLSPQELLKLAKKRELKALALTDHDTTDGIPQALAAGRELGIEVIPGIEFSTHYENKDIHILGLDIEYDSDYFQEQLEVFRDSRSVRNRKMIKKLQEHGIRITQEDMEREFPDSVWTRAHFARYLEEHGYVGSKNEAFDRFLGDRACCFVPREKVSPWDAIALIHASGGYAVLAHPLLYGMGTQALETLVDRLTQAGLDGIEAIYSANAAGETARMKLLAARYGLKITGGSDFHGSNKPGLQLGIGYGSLDIPYSIWENLKKV